ncbi:GatB/YqeY domain-containing protein [Mesonia sp. HuA40]|uniref:GatB/YqeY domain-containing protein n=1 Tax=Mesonia sp. HuA40 TaxID=2602761 RepID=UPI0011C83845|nr:GatB/YqeY domain-containing protein [Mesonia sp. HuA40]TXK73687.1 GatB/YqeY domain-containing protein [Mesonia sp. HuA40]
MSLEKQVMIKMKEAMKSKDQMALGALRAIKNALILAKTEANATDLTEEQEIQIVQKLVKQRRDSAEIYQSQQREDLAEPELAEAEVIAQFLPKQLTESEIEAEVQAIIAEVGASGMQDMGKVMGIASQKMMGKADGKTISAIVRKKLA